MDTPSAIEALIGMPSQTARHLVSASVAGSDEAVSLLEAMPGMIRNLSISTVSVPERTVGEIRGPIMWSETLAARAASAGDPDVFVSATHARAYDTPENRVLASALALIAKGGKNVDRLRRTGREEPALFARARHNGDVAQRFLDHRALSGVRSDQVSRRAVARLHHDNRRRSYRPVVAMLQRAADPLDVATLRTFCDDTTTAEHDLLIGVVDQLGRRGVRLPPFLVADHALEAGPVRYCHASHPSSRVRAGVSVGRRLLVTPAGESPPDAIVINGRGDLIAAVDEAIVDQRL